MLTCFWNLQTIVEINEGDTKLQPVGAKGKQTSLKLLTGKLNTSAVKRVRVIGREEATLSERCCDEHILLLLQGKRTLLTSRFIGMLWFPGEPISDAADARSAAPCRAEAEGDMSAFERLNESQRKVSIAMIGDEEPLVIVHGLQFSLFSSPLPPHSLSDRLTRSSWNRKNNNYRLCAAVLGKLWTAHMGHCAVQRGCQEHRSEPLREQEQGGQAQRQLQAHRLQGVPL